MINISGDSQGMLAYYTQDQWPEASIGLQSYKNM